MRFFQCKNLFFCIIRPISWKNNLCITVQSFNSVGHADHLRLVSAPEDICAHLESALQHAMLPQGLVLQSKRCTHLLIANDDALSLAQVFILDNGTPTKIINSYPLAQSPYGMVCTLQEIWQDNQSMDAILHLKIGSVDIYAFDALHAINGKYYQKNKSYYVNFSAIAHTISPSQGEKILITDTQAVRHHRAFARIVADNDSQVPDDIDAKVAQYLQDNPSLDSSPITIDTAKMCAYLFGDTHGQQDEAWCQGQILGKSKLVVLGRDFYAFDVAILREPEIAPFVVRIYAIKDAVSDSLAVHDYLCANIWLQAHIYADNQR